jgi:anthranilate phosphoribosyltransferase
MADGVARAREAIDTGAAADRLQRLRELAAGREWPAEAG